MEDRVQGRSVDDGLTEPDHLLPGVGMVAFRVGRCGIPPAP